MHRSSSYYLSSSASASASASAAGAGAAGLGASGSSGPGGGPGGAAGAVDVDQLPTYDPRSDAAKKEALDASRAELARALVHLIPVVVLVCGLLLWSLSTADAPEVVDLLENGGGHKMVTRVRLIAQRSGSASGWKGSGMMTGTEDPDPIEKAHGTRRMVLRSEI